MIVNPNQAALWCTPKASTGGADSLDCPTHTGGINLKLQVSHWTTPQAHDQHGAASEESKAKRRDKAGCRDLGSDAAQWPTPAARDIKNQGTPAAAAARIENGHAQPLNEAATNLFSPPAPAIHDGPASSETRTTSRQRLNPAFVCWLMGWPWWWTRAEPINFAALEMESWRCKALLHLSSLCGESESLAMKSASQ